MSPGITLEREESFDQMFENIDADAGIGGPEEVLSRGRDSHKSGLSQRSNSKSRRSTGAASKIGPKEIVAKDLFGAGSDSDSSCASTRSKSRRGKKDRSSSVHSRNSRKKDNKPAVSHNKKVQAIDIFGDSTSDINLSEDERSVSSKSRPDSKSKSMSNIPWNTKDPSSNQREFEKMVKERVTLTKLVEDLKKENSELRKEVRNSDDENRKLRQALADGAGNTHKLKAVQEENQRMQQELRETVERASKMVKDREAATDQLLEELEKLREETNETRKMFDATLFKNKQKTEELDRLNDEYAKRIQDLEQRLQGSKKK